MQDGPGRTASTPSTAMKVADLLRERIAQGYFAPGQQINEKLVSSELQLSRGPLREALQRLSQEGLLVSKRNRGVFVVELTARDVGEIYSVREVLELAAVKNITAQPAERRRQVSDRLKRIAVPLAGAADAGDWNSVFKRDLEFHTTLVSESGNTRLLRSYKTLATESLICMTNFKQAYPTPGTPSQHLELAELIARGSISEIRSAFHRHLSV